MVFVGDVMVAEIWASWIARGIDPLAPFGSSCWTHDLRASATSNAWSPPAARPRQALHLPRGPGRVAGAEAPFRRDVGGEQPFGGDFGRTPSPRTGTGMRKAGLPYFGGGIDATEGTSR